MRGKSSGTQGQGESALQRGHHGRGRGFPGARGQAERKRGAGVCALTGGGKAEAPAGVQEGCRGGGWLLSGEEQTCGYGVQRPEMVDEARVLPGMGALDMSAGSGARNRPERPCGKGSRMGRTGMETGSD